ncbi:MAG: S1C family serine protease [Lachnospiraceae bacterium]|nr:S1C family serine protease [Lachnospiraceae bacterium]
MKPWKKYGALAIAAVVLAGAGTEAAVLFTPNEVNAEETEETQRTTLNIVSDEEEDTAADSSEKASAAAGTASETVAETEESERVTLNKGNTSDTDAANNMEEESSVVTEEDTEETETSEDTETSEEIQLGAGSMIDSVADSSGSIVMTDVSEIVENCMPSIVSVTNVSAEEESADIESDADSDLDYYYYYYYGDEEETAVDTAVQETVASGIIIAQSDEELLIVTSYHVVSDATELSVGFSADAEDEDDLTVSARLKGTNSSCDLAVIAVELSDIEDSVLEQLKIAKLGSSEDLKIGQAAIALSNTPADGPGATVGVISSLNSTVSIDGVSLDVYVTDAAVNIGSSGAALLNASGEVIGICIAGEAADSADEKGYVIPIDTAIPVLEQLINKETRDKLSDSERGYIGVTVLSVSEEAAETYNMPEGAFVYEVTEGSAAEEAGIQKGDIITAIEGESLSSSDELIDKMSYYAPGDTITLEVQTANNGTYETREVEVTLQEGSTSDELTEEEDQEEQSEDSSMDDGFVPGEDDIFGNEHDGDSDGAYDEFDDGFSDGFEDYNSQFN